VNAIAAARARHADEIEPFSGSSASPIRPERLMRDLQSVLTAETLVAADASYATVWVASYLQSLAPGMRFLMPRGLAGLGWGLPLAIGAKVAQPENPVAAVVGDGGFAHVWSELETMVRTKTPVVLTVLNNGVLGFQKDAEDVKFGRHTKACYFAPVDHAAIARACGARSARIERAEDYLPALRTALTSKETWVLDVITDPAAYPPITAFDQLDEVRARLTSAR
jgi:acetolactate synthase-1/2/3 large subunit